MERPQAPEGQALSHQMVLRTAAFSTAAGFLLPLFVPITPSISINDRGLTLWALAFSAAGALLARRIVKGYAAENFVGWTIGFAGTIVLYGFQYFCRMTL